MATHGPPCIRNQRENAVNGKPQMRGRKSPIWRKEGALSLRRGKQIAEQKRKKSSWKMLKSECPNEGRKSPNWGKTEKQLHSHTQWTYARIVNEKERVHVLEIPIMCTILHFQWTFLPQSVMEVQFPGYRHFVLPTHNTVSWGTWLPLSTLCGVTQVLL